MSVNSWVKSEFDIYKVVSSAQDTIFPSHDLYISLTYMRYNNGPRIDPCGTPHLMGI